jgi:hypothetical protein
MAPGVGSKNENTRGPVENGRFITYTHKIFHYGKGYDV